MGAGNYVVSCDVIFMDQSAEPVSSQNAHIGCCCAWKCAPGGRILPQHTAVLADQAAEDLPALDPGGDIDGVAGRAHRGFLLQAMVRTVPVIVPGVLSQDLAQMPLTDNQ